MASTLDEVPPRSSAPLQSRIASAVMDVAFSLSLRKDHTVNRTILGIFDRKAKASSKPIDGIFSQDFTTGDHSDQFVRIYTSSKQQPGSTKLPTIVYFHGGGFSAFSADSTVFDKFCRSLAKDANAVVVSVNYRLVPEFGYPTPYDDCWQALQWIQSDCQNGYLSSVADPSQIFLMGDSAGGNIAHNMMVKEARNDNQISSLKVKGVILVCPFFGGVERTPSEIKMPDALFLTLKRSDWFWATFLPPGSDRDHPSSNIFGPSGDDISGLSLPPILVLIGSMDHLQDWQGRYVNKLQEMGKQVEPRFLNMYHAEYSFGMMKPTVDVVVEFIKSKLS